MAVVGRRGCRVASGEGRNVVRAMVQLGRGARSAAPGQPPPMRGRRRHERGQAGFGLLEVVISVALVSLTVLGLAAAFLTLVRTNAATTAQQEADHAAANYSESLKASGYRPCSPGVTPDYSGDASLWTPPSGVQVRIVDVEFWDPAAGSYVATCPSGVDAGTQRLTVVAEYRDRDRQAQIVKRNR